MRTVSDAIWQRNFSVRLRRHRVGQGMSQTELGNLAHVHRTYISELENCRKVPTLQVVFSLSEALQIEVWQLLYDESPLQ